MCSKHACKIVASALVWYSKCHAFYPAGNFKLDATMWIQKCFSKWLWLSLLLFFEFALFHLHYVDFLWYKCGDQEKEKQKSVFKMKMSADEMQWKASRWNELWPATECHLGDTWSLMLMLLNVDIGTADEISRKITLLLAVSWTSCPFFSLHRTLRLSTPPFWPDALWPSLSKWSP